MINIEIDKYILQIGDIIYNYINNNNENILTIILAIIGGIISIKLIFIELREQFHQKIIYEAWQDIQEKLYRLSNALTSHGSETYSQEFSITQSHNPLFRNQLSQAEFIREQQKKFNNSYDELYKQYINFLSSYYNYEIILQDLSEEMKKTIDLLEKIGPVEFYKLSGDIYPNIFENTININDKFIKQELSNYRKSLNIITDRLNLIRVEIQKKTIGKTLNKKITKRFYY